MSFYSDAKHLFFKELSRFGSLGELAAFVHMSKSTLARWAAGQSRPSFLDLSHIADALGYRLVHRECVCLGEEDTAEYVTVPIIRHPYLLRDGFIPSENIDGFCHVDRDFDSVAGRSDLIVIRQRSDDMAPTIPAGSLVLIDRASRVIEQGRLYLVRTPRECTMIRRVQLVMSRGRQRIVFSTDSTGSACAESYSVTSDYAGDPTRAVLGRAIWIRKDISCS